MLKPLSVSLMSRQKILCVCGLLLVALPISAGFVYRDALLRSALGIPALIVWVWFIVTLVRDFWRKRTSEYPSLSNAGLAVIGAMLAAGLFEYNFGDSEFLMLFLVLVTLPYAHRAD